MIRMSCEDSFRVGSEINLELGGIRHGYAAGLMRPPSIHPSVFDRARRGKAWIKAKDARPPVCCRITTPYFGGVGHVWVRGGNRVRPFRCHVAVRRLDRATLKSNPRRRRHSGQS